MVASVHIMSVSRQGVAKMRNRRGSRIYQPIDVFTIVHFLRRYTLIHLRIHIDTSSYLNKAPRHDDASTLHNLMALGPVAPAQRAARREPGSGVWCRLITCSFDGGLSSDRTPQCGAALSIPHTPHTSPPHNEGRPAKVPLVSHVPARPRRSARQDKSLAHEAQTTVSDPALQGRVAGLGARALRLRRRLRRRLWRRPGTPACSAPRRRCTRAT